MFGWFKKSRFASHGPHDPVAAILGCDLESAEAMRGELTQSQVNEIVDTYLTLESWASKDTAVHLLQDCSPEDVRQVMQDAIRSPTPETRAIALCSLSGDLSMFSQFVRSGVLDSEAVDQAIQARMNS